MDSYNQKRTINPSKSKKNNRSRSTSPNSFFASSISFNSPDPSQLPIPSFDEDLDSPPSSTCNSVASSPPLSPVDKTNALRNILNIRSDIQSICV